MNERFQSMMLWLQSLPELQDKSWTDPLPASSDASFRRYFRINVIESETADKKGFANSYIIMDAPVEHEDCKPFIKVSAELHAMGLNVPQVIEQDLQQGFLLLSDLGSTTYLSVLKEATESEVDRLYRDALQALVVMQVNGKDKAKTLPSYDLALLNTEMSLFPDWLLNKHLDIHLSDAEKHVWQTTTQVLADSALQQPQTYVHRDYHSRNLMIIDDNQSDSSRMINPGVLDFQDAVHGAITYDAVSLLRDCYIKWPAEQVKEWQRFYFLQLCEHNKLGQSEWAGFQKSMDLMGIQRHLKASGIFARLFHRDGKDGYLNDIPLTLSYISEVGRDYKEMHSLVDLVEEKLLPKIL